ncbi:MAG: hypothetical protein ABJO09_14160 [Hyphomicrobiales bacterium]
MLLSRTIWIGIFALYFATYPVFSKENHDESAPDYMALTAAGDYSAAFRSLLQEDDSFSLSLRAYHLLIGAGVERDICAAVEIFERLYTPKNPFGQGPLNYAYRGNWAAIASLEGSAAATLAVGVYYMQIPELGPLKLFGGEQYTARLAHDYLRRAKELGSIYADTYISALQIKYPDLSQEYLMEFPIPSKIICLPRSN